MHIINFAHGEIYMLGGMFMWLFTAEHDWFIVSNYVTSMVLAMVIVAAIGVALYWLCFRKFRGNLMPGLIVSVGLIFIIQASTATWFPKGVEDRAIPSPEVMQGVVNFAGATLSKERLLVILIAIVFVVLLYLFLMRTKYGRSMRACAQDADAALLQGISVDGSCTMAMAIGCALAAAGGALAGSVFYVNPYIGSFPLLKAFVAIVLGGMGSLPGTILAGFVIGGTESFGGTYLTGTYSTMLIFGLLIVILVIRPMGLFGREGITPQ
ncbi:branched-chain amino acid ABC transporter permease, partial [Chloroflexota bacterium]